MELEPKRSRARRRQTWNYTTNSQKNLLAVKLLLPHSSP